MNFVCFDDYVPSADTLIFDDHIFRSIDLSAPLILDNFRRGVAPPSHHCGPWCDTPPLSRGLDSCSSFSSSTAFTRPSNILKTEKYKPCQHCKQCQQCKQCIARCYLDLWCNFIPYYPPHCHYNQPYHRVLLLIIIMAFQQIPTRHHHHPDTVTQHPPSSSTLSSTHRQIIAGQGTWVWSPISHTVSFNFSVPNSL